jgi:hypothetical protein
VIFPQISGAQPESHPEALKKAVKPPAFSRLFR